jgi:RNA polymerase sigma factor (sigma-70 family)
LDELQLISAIKSGDNSAYRILVDDFKHKIFNTCIGIVQSAEDAEDLTQEVFIEIFRSVIKFKCESKLSTWIYRIAVTKSLEFLRAKKRKKRFAAVIPLFDNKDALKEIDKKYFYHPGIELENKEKAAILFKAIDSLPDNQKTAFLLHRTEGLSYEEISEIMKTTLSAVESLMFRAKQNLQKILADYYNHRYET